ncbi:MAG: 2'-5' RNA ligase family protein [Acidimicrobiales bacterium]
MATRPRLTRRGTPSTATWDEWQREYRHGALYVFPPPDVAAPVDELRRRHDPKSAAICSAHISLSGPLPGPVTEAQWRELGAAVSGMPRFNVRYGPLRSFPPHPGVVYAIGPEAEFDELRRAVHATSVFDHARRREPIAPHMTIAEFISLERTQDLLDELQDHVAYGDFVCDHVTYAVPDDDFRFRPVLSLPLRRW